MSRRLGILGAVSIVAALLLAPPAEAHPPRSRGPAPTEATWERLAGCESDHNWHIRGRTYSGGLQFDRTTWRGVGGKGVAADASRSEQIARANTLWRARGFQPWPACSRKLGLRR